MITTVSLCTWGEQLPVRPQLWQICPLISSTAWVRRAEHEGFLAFCSVELAELIRMTATSASVQRKGQRLRLDARQFSRQLENNTMKAHSIHAAGTEALPTGTSGKMFLWRAGGWRRTPHGWLVTACHSSPSLHCTVKVCHPLCPCALLVSLSQYQELLSATLLGVHPAGLGVSLISVPCCGKSCRALCWRVGRVLGVPFPPHPPAPPCFR